MRGSIENFIRSLQISLATVGCMMAVAWAVRAENAFGQDEPPEVNSVLEAHIKALGGQETLENVRSIVTRGTIEAPASGHRGELVLYQVPGKYLLEIQMHEVGTIQQGSDGQSVWEVAPHGERLLEGKERVTALLNNAQLFPELQWISGDYQGSIRLVGKEDLKGQEVFNVEFQPEGGFVIHRFFDAETYMAIHSKAFHESSEAGTLEVDILSSDFREVDGVQMPFKQEYRRQGNPFYTVTVREIVFNEEIEDEKFAPPASVRQLINN